MAILRQPRTQDEQPDIGYSMPAPQTPQTTAPAPTTADPGLGMPPIQDNGTSGSQFNPSQPVDTTGWDVDGYGTPGYTAAAGSFGSAPSGWDPTKWNDPNHQTPKYVWGRIYQEARASGDPNWQQIANQRLMQAYPGTQIHDDLAITPWGERIDLYTDYGTDPRSQNGISWGVEGANQGGGSNTFQGLNQLMTPTYGGAPSGGGATSGGSDQPPVPGWVRIANGDWVPPDHPEALSGGRWAGGTGMANPNLGQGGTVPLGPQAPQGGMQPLYDMIGQVLGLGGDYNTGILNRRIESSREDMNRARSSQSDMLKAQLAERGLLGSGAETTAITGLEEDLGDMFAGSVRDIYADESARSDDRLLKTMSIASGLSQRDADRLVDWFNAQTNKDVGMGQIGATNRRTDMEGASNAADNATRRDLGFADLGLRGELGRGQLGLDTDVANNNYNLGAGRLGYDYDAMNMQDEWNRQQRLIDWYRSRYQPVSTDPTEGYE